MSDISMGAVVTAVALLIFAIIVVAFLGPGHNILLEGFDDVFETLNASRVGLGL